MKKRTVIKHISITSVLTVLFLTQLFIDTSKAYEVIVLEKSYDVRFIFQTNTIKGNYYQPDPDTGKPLLVLVHGATYGKWMWDVPGYSWIDFFVAQLGYPVLAIDRLGYGDSSHPNGYTLIPRRQVNSLKQVLCQVRQENGLRQIIWIGHSMGALLGNMIAGKSDLVDGLITIGWVHGQEVLTTQPLLSMLTNFKNDYITWTNEERTAAFYFLEGADQEIVDYDNSHAFPMPRGSLLAIFDPDCFVLSNIDIPVFLASGEYDAIWVDIDLDSEANLFENASITTFLQSEAGHTNLLHISNQSFLYEISNWLEKNF